MSSVKAILEIRQWGIRLLESLEKGWPVIPEDRPGYTLSSGVVCHKCVTPEEFLGDDCHPLPDNTLFRCDRCLLRCQFPRA
jgi:hypothetical protein